MTSLFVNATVVGDLFFHTLSLLDWAAGRLKGAYLAVKHGC